MIPLKDSVPTKAFPVVTVIIIGINVLVFGYEIYLGKGNENFISTYGLVPSNLTNPFYAEFDGNLNPFLSIFSSMFVHAGYLHLIGNMLYMWIFGNNVEDSMGPLRFILFYLLTGALAALSHVATEPAGKIPMVGASGAISGILGAYLLLFPRAKVLTLIFIGLFARLATIPAVWVLLFWIILNVINGTVSLGSRGSGGVAWFAHIGGFGAGLLLIKLFRRPDYMRGLRMR